MCAKPQHNAAVTIRIAAIIPKYPNYRDEWRAVVALLVLFLPNTLFWATYEQQGNTIALWADVNTDRTVNFLAWTAEIPTTWFQAFNPFMIFAFTPFVVALWKRQAVRGTEPSTLTKMALGCFGVTAANVVMALAAFHADGGKASWLWAVRVLHRHHHRRALPLAGRAIARHQGRSQPHPVDDDGRLAGDEFCVNFAKAPETTSGLLWPGAGHPTADRVRRS
jgi:hypothetical protein